MANWFLLLHPPERRNPGKGTDWQAGDVASPQKRKLRKIATKGSVPVALSAGWPIQAGFAWMGIFVSCHGVRCDNK
jgi:hypothetical protein